MIRDMFLWSLPVVFAFSLFSCGLTKEELLNLTDSAQDQALLENEFSAIFDQVDEISREDDDIGGRIEASELLPTCASGNYDASTQTLTIDFGAAGCLCMDGRIRRGKVVAVFDGKYRTKGAVTTVSLDSYSVDGLSVEGTNTITNLGNAAGHFAYSYEVRGAKVMLEDGATVTWMTDATVERIEGDGTLTIWDDVYLATGSSTGVNRRGINFTANTQTPLKKRIEVGCLRNFVSGVLEIRDEDNGNKMTLDYDPEGGESCDKKATVQFNDGNEFEILLR